MWVSLRDRFFFSLGGGAKGGEMRKQKFDSDSRALSSADGP